jgi:cyanuric acid amidohydrolase
MRANRVLKTAMSAPDDAGAIEAALAEAELGLDRVRAVMCMTEGDGLARGFATLRISQMFHDALGWPIADVPNRLPLIMIGGCSGLVVPYAAIFVDDPDVEAGGEGGGLAIGVTTTPAIEPRLVGSLEMVVEVAEAVRQAMHMAGITDPADVHCVQIKCPWPTDDALEAAAREGSVTASDAAHAGVLARGAGALGVAVALGELDVREIESTQIGSDLALWSSVASASAGTERGDVAVIVIGNAPTSTSPYIAAHAVLEDGLDVAAVKRAVVAASAESRGAPEELVEHVFVKSAVDLSGSCRGRRHVLRSDYLAPYSWLIAKAVIHATVAGVVGDPMMQVSGGGEHQGPPGGGLVAVIAKRN